jgi:signal transduction histidine kinase
MDDVAAKPDFSTRKSWWLRASRLLQYALVQLLIVVVCLFALHQSLPEPPSRYLLTEFNAKEGGTERSVTLPHYTSSRFSMNDPPLYSGHFSWPGGEQQHAWSVYLPRFNNGVEVLVNGVVILDSRRDPVANRPDRNTPEIAVIPTSLLHDGQNDLTIRLLVWGPLTGFLDSVYVGPDQALRPYYEQRTLLFVTLPVVFAAWQAILAVILTIMGVVRRHEPAYGILAAAMTLGVAQSFLPVAVDQSQFSRLNAILITSGPLEGSFVLTFAMLFLGWRWPRWAALIFAPGLILVVVALFGDRATISQFFVWLGMPTIGLYLVLLALIVAHSVLKRQDVAVFVLGCAVTILLTCWIRDMLSVLQIAPDGRIFVARLSYSAMLVAIGAGLTWRFARALNQVDSFAGRLVTQVRQAEDQLKASFAREEERARAAALALERTRLMRDLHDGLGGQLVSIVALSERGDASAPIGDAARAALKDLRLVIDSMDDIGGDLMLALGSWRERATAQLRPHDIALDWHTLSPQGLPVHPELRPWHVIQIVRLLDEALTNAVKHAGARCITVTIETLADASGLPSGRISVEDDGKGFALTLDGAAATDKKAARGLRNMRSRATRCGIELELSSGAGGTRVRLTLPRRFPDSDTAGA